jgi:arabinose-5-phosphate isomerase
MTIKLVVFDFDGVFTNGQIMFDNNGNIIKNYNVKDGLGLSLLKDIEIGVISGYKKNLSQQNILDHLNISYISLETNDKLVVLNEWCNILNINILTDVAYMGDDINDLTIINKVNLSGCPLDAVSDVKNNVNFISDKNGGEGCIRDFCEYIINYNLNINNSNNNIIVDIKKDFYYQMNNLNLPSIIELADILNNISGNIYISGVGKSGNIAKHCADLLKCISCKSFFFDILNSTHGDIGTLNKNDIILFFSNSGNTIEVVNIIPILRNIGLQIIGICSKEQSQFKKICNKIYITPYSNEISGEINMIPTNSCMSQLIFSNILVSIMKQHTTLSQYKENHLSGNIGKKLMKIKDVLITEFPKIYIDNIDTIKINTILLEMTKYHVGCCCFIDNMNKLYGILTDGDIRRILLEYKNIEVIKLDYINKDYIYESDIDKYVSLCIKKGTGILPIIVSDKLIGLINTYKFD